MFFFKTLSDESTIIISLKKNLLFDGRKKGKRNKVENGKLDSSKGPVVSRRPYDIFTQCYIQEMNNPQEKHRITEKQDIR